MRLCGEDVCERALWTLRHDVSSSIYLLNIHWILPSAGASLVAQQYRIHLTIQEGGVQSPGREDPLEKKMATHSKILAWKIPWTEDPGRLQPMRLQKSWK